jgi:hypothetical protein
MVQTISLTTDAGVSRSIKTGASPLEMNDIMRTPLISEAVSQNAIRTRNKVNNVAGITGRRTDKNMSVANRN